MGEEETPASKFYGPATSCDELSLLVYTLNGFYVVEEKNQDQKNTNGSKKIEVVYCKFHQPNHRDTQIGNELK